MRPALLTLTSDFGWDGPYVAAMKGVVLGLAPGTQLVDVSHGIAPQNIVEGAFVLSSIVDAFPEGAIHLAVVDPGVGTDRRLVAVRVDGQWFVLPDNGLISGALRGRSASEVRELSNPNLRRKQVSSTFHGRDILAPAAAHLARGGSPEELGPARPPDSLIRLRTIEAAENPQGLVAEVIFKDPFGNLITNVQQPRVAHHPAGDWVVEIKDVRIEGISRTYGDRSPGDLIALAGSSGWIEVAVVNGDAGRQLSAGPGTTVLFRKKPLGRRD